MFTSVPIFSAGCLRRRRHMHDTHLLSTPVVSTHGSVSVSVSVVVGGGCGGVW